MVNKFDCSDIKPYLGKTFITAEGSKYKITEDGKIEGRKSMEGASISKIGGVDKELYNLLVSALGEYNDFESLIQQHAKPVSIGKLLVFSLTKDSARKTNRTGLVTAPLEGIV